MNTKSIHKPLLASVVVAALLMAFGLVNEPSAPANGNNIFSLRSPPFVGVARAETSSIASLIEDEAGISAYFQAVTSINLGDVRDVFRTIEAETIDYIIGSIPVADYPESEDVHVYVHRDGWILAYYLAADPVGKIFDWRDYADSSGAAITTKLENALAVVAGEAGILFSSATYYDFRYPNANHLMLIAEDTANGNDFQVKLPGSFGYYERSWSLGSSVSCHYAGANATWNLDGVQIQRHDCGWHTSQGILTVAQLLPDQFHTISVDVSDGSAWGGLALVYRVPQ